MGCGKSTVGRLLSKKLNYHFLDSDQMIEEKEQLSVVSIFENKGEAYFRKLEKQFLLDLNCENTVIASGGGMVELDQIDQLFSQKGVAVFLRCSATLLIKRIEFDKISRPNFKNEDYFKSLMTKRAPLYERADLVIDCDLLTADEVCHQIMDQLSF